MVVTLQSVSFALLVGLLLQANDVDGGLVTQKAYAGTTLDYTYDNSAYLTGITDGTNSITYTSRTAAGLPLAAQYSNGMGVSWQYQFARFVSQMKQTRADGTVLSQWDANYEPSGLRRGVWVSPSGESSLYAYDEASRLKTETRTVAGGDACTTSYAYDLVGNRTGKTVNGAAEYYSYSSRYELQQIAHADGATTYFAYDANGNTLGKARYAAGSGTPAESIAYEWDALNRLTSATKEVDGATTAAASFEYDPFGWQMKRQTTGHRLQAGDWSEEAREFGYGAGGELLTETMPDAGCRTYVNGGVDQVLWSVDSGSGSSSKFWHTDINGSVFAVTNGAGQVLERQRYDAYGQTEITDATGMIVSPQSAIGNRVGFQGRTGIPELGLQYFRNRFYDPGIGRWLSRDPLGLNAGLNEYWAFGDDPINRVDPLGTDWRDWVMAAAALAAERAKSATSPTIPGTMVPVGAVVQAARRDYADVQAVASGEKTVGQVAAERASELPVARSVAAYQRAQAIAQDPTKSERQMARAGLEFMETAAEDTALVVGAASSVRAPVRAPATAEATAARTGTAKYTATGMKPSAQLDAAVRESTLKGGAAEGNRAGKVGLGGADETPKASLPKRLAKRAQQDAVRDEAEEFGTEDPESAEFHGGEGVIYRVPARGTRSKKPYIGSSDDWDKRQKVSSDGRDRSQATTIDRYQRGDRATRRAKEQQGIEDEGGLENTDNERNEIKE